MENEFSTDFGEMECDHLIELRRYLKNNKFEIWSEHSEGYWVYVRCKDCNVIYEIELTNY